MPWTRAVAAIKASRMGLGSGTCSLAQRCATLELMDRDGCKKGLTHGYPFTPGGHLPVTLAGFDLAELRHDIRIQDKHQSNSAGLGIQSAFGGLNSTSAAPGMCSASASVLERPASLWYSSMLSSTCAGRPRSVMNTGPRWAAFLGANFFIGDDLRVLARRVDVLRCLGERFSVGNRSCEATGDSSTAGQSLPVGNQIGRYCRGC